MKYFSISSLKNVCLQVTTTKIYSKTWRNIRDIENELYGRKHNVSTMNAQSEKVVNIREVKRGA